MQSHDDRDLRMQSKKADFIQENTRQRVMQNGGLLSKPILVSNSAPVAWRG